MSASAYVDQATAMAKTLVARELAGSSDVEGALRRCEVKYGLPYSFLWSLRYRPPKRVFVDLFVRLADAVEQQRQRQEQLFVHERSIAQSKGRVSKALVGAADALAGKALGQAED